MVKTVTTSQRTTVVVVQGRLQKTVDTFMSVFITIGKVAHTSWPVGSWIYLYMKNSSLISINKIPVIKLNI